MEKYNKIRNSLKIMSINNYQLIDETKWGRKDIFEFFRPFLDSSVSVTTEVECGVTFSECKSKGTSFFLHSLYAVLKATNEIPELRYRLKDGKLVIYDRVDALTPIKVNKMGKFVEAFVQYDTDFIKFYRDAYSSIHDPRQHGRRPVATRPDTSWRAVRSRATERQ